MTDSDWGILFPLPCSECQNVSHKALGQLVMRDRLPCDHCGLPIVVAREYGHAKLTKILEGLGRFGDIIPKREEDE